MEYTALKRGRLNELPLWVEIDSHPMSNESRSPFFCSRGSFIDDNEIHFSLDAAILKAFVLDQVGVTDEDIVYSKDPDEVLQAVNEGRAEAGFILNPVSVTQLRSIALNDERMPPKTTYFYPKVLSGLTIYKMD